MISLGNLLSDTQFLEDLSSCSHNLLLLLRCFWNNTTCINWLFSRLCKDISLVVIHFIFWLRCTRCELICIVSIFNPLVKLFSLLTLCPCSWSFWWSPSSVEWLICSSLGHLSISNIKIELHKHGMYNISKYVKIYPYFACPSIMSPYITILAFKICFHSFQRGCTRWRWYVIRFFPCLAYLC